MVHKTIIQPYYEVFINDETGKVDILSHSKHAKGRKLKQWNRQGYLACKIHNKTVNIHSIVAEYFLGEREKNKCVNHKDGNKQNNRPENLEYVTVSENIKHAIREGLHICNRPEQIGSYKDGRTRDKVKYKAQWYQQNKDRILQKAKNRYYDQKEKGCL